MLFFALNASFAHQALGVRTLAAHLKNNGGDCDILECNINERTDEILYKLYKASKNRCAIGFSCYIWNIGKMLYFAETLKKLLPDIIIVLGGPEVSYYDDKDFCKLYPFVDYIIKGEGEAATLELYKSITAAITPNITAYSCKNKADMKNMSDLSELSSSFGDIYANAKNYHIVYYESSRGCPYNCSYCMSGIKTPDKKEIIRGKDPETVLRELKYFEDLYYLHEDCKINIVKFCDRTFNFDIKRAGIIYEELINRAKENSVKYKKPLMPYQFEIYPTLFSDESFEILRNAPKDLFHMEIGIQSLNSDTLDAIGRKNFDISRAVNNISRLKELGNIPLHVDLIAGLPLETMQTFINGFNILYNFADFIQIGFLKLLKGTRIRKEADKHGYVYQSEPPYTVLQNKYMQYEEIALLHDIERVYNKYTSKAYRQSLGFVHKQLFDCNQFDIFKTLALYWRSNGLFDSQISQRESFAAFYKAFEPFGIGSELKELLSADFYAYEKKNPSYLFI